MRALQLVRETWPLMLVPLGFVIGWRLDRHFDSTMVDYRNKSKLFARELKPGETETWK
ncbi:NADH dehydrogenase [ubiquinone] 1 beta subcomplex subunit 1 [Lethenteron reissneri]|uniref:NADH dehydrogenase [ubiquinone] 1 beta subcomplex subunit 1 n=1 Tax=Lethenteron reissneri TaxID=7753 RepID=UPI002AB64E2A|nr:NADH dehydrogenase [ubiquinone] 1 beta subcomplex subunit 1 [Lethenteron reissneri]XP_061429834.1 NADH dehydrogenase [ubiquinone] 1 beta subcomplex subunit 1 [Lethenteron reissneri]